MQEDTIEADEGQTMSGGVGCIGRPVFVLRLVTAVARSTKTPSDQSPYRKSLQPDSIMKICVYDNTVKHSEYVCMII